MSVNQKHAHWTDDELLDRLYVSGGECDCAECAARWRTLTERRAGLLEQSRAAELSDQRLREQRAAIWKRIETPRRPLVWRAVPAAATALVLLFGVALNQPAPRVNTPVTTATAQISDEQLMTEVASLLNQDTPRAADPMRALFSETSATEVR